MNHLHVCNTWVQASVKKENVSDVIFSLMRPKQCLLLSFVLILLVNIVTFLQQLDKV